MELPTDWVEGKKEELKEGICLCAQVESAIFPKICNCAIDANQSATWSGALTPNLYT